MIPPGMWKRVGRNMTFTCGVCGSVSVECETAKNSCCLLSARAPGTMLRCRCNGVLNYIYHIYFQCRECGKWQKRHW